LFGWVLAGFDFGVRACFCAWWERFEWPDLELLADVVPPDPLEPESDEEPPLESPELSAPADESDPELLARLAELFPAALPGFGDALGTASTVAVISTATTPSVPASIFLARLSGRDPSPSSHFPHCCNPCAQLFIQRPLRGGMFPVAVTSGQDSCISLPPALRQPSPCSAPTGASRTPGV
jgi:hypothetical protein